MLSLMVTLNATPIVIDLGQTTGQPADLTSEYNRLLGQVSSYNLTHDPDLVAPALNNGIKTETPDGDKSIEINFREDFTGYLMFKWGDMDHFWYVKDLDELTFDSTVQNSKSRSTNPVFLGLSHWDNWETENSVPDGGITLALMGVGLAGLAGVSKLNKK